MGGYQEAAGLSVSFCPACEDSSPASSRRRQAEDYPTHLPASQGQKTLHNCDYQWYLGDHSSKWPVPCPPASLGVTDVIRLGDSRSRAQIQSRDHKKGTASHIALLSRCLGSFRGRSDLVSGWEGCQMRRYPQSSLLEMTPMCCSARDTLPYDAPRIISEARGCPLEVATPYGTVKTPTSQSGD